MPKNCRSDLLRQNCISCKYSQIETSITGSPILVCNNMNSKEYKNMVDRYICCPFHKPDRH